MGRLAYVNGRYLPHSNALVHIEDRGYQFGDGVYEVVSVVNQRLLDLEEHLNRLNRSLNELKIDWPLSRNVLQIIITQLLKRNRVVNGLIYLQISRGVAPRNHKFPKSIKPSLVITTARMNFKQSLQFQEGVKVITIPDIRWSRCDIKSTSLLPNCLGKQQAADANAFEAWQFNQQQFITEGTSSNAWIVTPEGQVRTRPPSYEILNGVTRISILRIIEKNNLSYHERAFTVEEAKSATEAFTSSATSFITPVIQIDDTKISNGNPGPLTRALIRHYRDYIETLQKM